MAIGCFIYASFPCVSLFGQSSLSGLVILAMGVILLRNLSIPGFAWLRVESRPLLYSLLSIGNLMITLVANIVLVGKLHLGLTGSLLATGCGYAGVVICTMPIILLRAALRIRTDIARSLLAFCAPLTSNLFTTSSSH